MKRTNLNILVLEDNRGLNTAISDRLQCESGCNCISVADYYEAVETINAMGFDWVISDWKLNDSKRDGIDFLEYYRGLKSDIKTILITGYRRELTELPKCADYVLEKQQGLVNNIISIICQDVIMDENRCDRNENLINELTKKIIAFEVQMGKAMAFSEDTKEIKNGINGFNDFLIGTKSKQGFISEQREANKSTNNKMKMLFWVNGILLAATFSAWVSVIFK